MKLKNSYFGMRHGEGFATVQGIIISDPECGTFKKYPLTVVGRWQVKHSIMRAKKMGLLGPSPRIYSSPFSRCAEAAEIVREVLGIKEKILLDTRLRERWFGSLDQTRVENYRQVWRLDRWDSYHKTFGVESPGEVENRMRDFVMGCERDHVGETFLLVSHGDPLQILATALHGILPGFHRKLPELGLAEIRELVLTRS
ncbi:MAG: histidine phosphatase family protein [bacterium]|nr:histidine phosphatase family protein [bacterium]